MFSREQTMSINVQNIKQSKTRQEMLTPTQAKSITLENNRVDHPGFERTIRNIREICTPEYKFV